MPEHKAAKRKYEQIQQEAVELLQQPALLSDTSDHVVALIRELQSYKDELELQNEELKRATRELTRLHQEYLNLYDFAPCGYVMLDAEGRITSTNQIATRLLGRKHPLLGQSDFVQYIAHEYREPFQSARQEAGETGERQSVELPVNSHQNKSPWVRIEIVADRNESGAVTRWRMVLLDISEQRQADTGLKFRNGTLTNILEKAADGICICYHTTGPPYVKFTHWNHRMTEIAGYTMDEINRLGWYQSLYPDPEIRKKAIDKMNAMRRGRDISAEDWRITTKSGKEKEISIFTSILRQDRERTYVLAVMREVTAQRIKAKHAHQIKKAESLSQMAGAIAHHFNNTLSVTIGNIQLAREYLAAGKSISANLDRAEHSALNAADMTGLLLTYLGQDSSKSEPFDLAAICKRQLRLFAVSVPENIHLETYCAPSGTVIEGNKTKIEQAFQALLTNACEAVLDKPRGRVTVSIGATEASDIKGDHHFPHEWKNTSEKYAVLTFTDTGGGITEQAMDRLFDPFFTDKLTGRGLGLAVVLGIVKAHHGCISVESRVGVGSTFRVFLPLTTPTAAIQAAGACALEQTAEFFGTVLLVDDNELVRDVSSDMLESLGFEVIIAYDGADAVKTFRDNQAGIRLVLSDLSMPRMNGWETLTAIRRIQPGVPFILTSGYDEARAMGGGHKEQPQAFLPKPVTLQSLTEAIIKSLE